MNESVGDLRDTEKQIGQSPASFGWQPSPSLHPPSSSQGAHSAASSPAPSQAHSHIPPRIRRRNRLITICLECRRRKLKCDKANPCGNCSRANRQCVYMGSALDPAAQQRLAMIKDRMGNLERTLEEDIARAGQAKSSSEERGAGDVAEDEDEGEEEVPEDLRDLMAHPLIVADATYHEDADDDMMDLGIMFGRMRMSERIGGMVRPKFTEELQHAIHEVVTVHGAPENHFVPPGFESQKFYGPGPDFVAPGSHFFFSPVPSSATVMQYLPSKNAGDRLMHQYWTAVHPVVHTVHRPSFERKYAAFWEDLHQKKEIPASYSAMVLAAFLSAVISMDEETVLTEYGITKHQLVDNFREGTETMLSRAHFLRSTKLETLQAFVMYLIPLCRGEVSRAHSALTGTVIRLAESMGLHRDGSLYGLPPVELQVRRLIWHHICFLDLRTAEATGPRPQIRKDEYDTKLPLNVNDVDLELPNPPTEDRDAWTDTTLTLMRMECNEMQRQIWNEGIRLDQKRTTVTSSLRKVQNFIAMLDKKYMHLFDRTKPLPYYAYLTYKLLTLRMHIGVLHRYATNHMYAMPDRLRQILLNVGVGHLEAAIQIETTPLLKTWAWYSGALQQYHSSLLILSELYSSENHYQEERVWKILDYVFELPPAMPFLEKSKLILTELARRVETFHSLRKVRAPTNMLAHVGPRKVTAPAFPKDSSGATSSPSVGTHPTPPPAQSSASTTVNTLAEQQYPSHVRGPLEKFPGAFTVGPWGSSTLVEGPSNEARPRTVYPFDTTTSGVSFGGIADGEAVYVPPLASGSLSPEDQLSLSNPSLREDNMQIGAGQSQPQVLGQVTARPESGFPDIDWSAFDQMFPPNMTFESLGDLMIPDFQFPLESGPE